MRTLFIILSLLLAGEAGAEPRACTHSNDKECWSGNTYRMAPIPLNDLKLTPEEEKEWCAMKMEAAMKAVEPWFNMFKNMTPRVLTAEEIADYNKFMDQWDAAKACWGKP